MKFCVIELDRIDLRILAELVSDARASQINLAEKVGLSPTACARVLLRLTERACCIAISSLPTS